MNKILITLVMLIAASVAPAQEIEFGTLEAIAKEGRAGFEIDYSEAVIHNMTEAEFAQYEKDWEMQPVRGATSSAYSLNERLNEN